MVSEACIKTIDKRPVWLKASTSPTKRAFSGQLRRALESHYLRQLSTAPKMVSFATVLDFRWMYSRMTRTKNTGAWIWAGSKSKRGHNNEGNPG